MKFGSFLITILVLSASTLVEAANIQDINTLKSAAKSFARSKIMNVSDDTRRVEIIVGNLDPRLRLVQCTEELNLFIPPGSRLQGNTTIGVRCLNSRPWSIYIPVRIAIYEKAIVTLRKMSRGELISQEDIILSEVDTSIVRGTTFTETFDLIGTKLKTTLKANQVISSTAICLICKGDTVIIKSDNKAVSVSVAGIALNDGGKGDRIRVQNNASRRIIDAVITTNGVVSVDI
ncbi:MAG: flagella basal body P-ring formation protein FlgA [Enterobacterales bacterium]|jgi:flagella basal body P-ring formation protein FlgA